VMPKSNGEGGSHWQRPWACLMGKTHGSLPSQGGSNLGKSVSVLTSSVLRSQHSPRLQISCALARLPTRLSHPCDFIQSYTTHCSV
jgi:hypothetical protein